MLGLMFWYEEAGFQMLDLRFYEAQKTKWRLAILVNICDFSHVTKCVINQVNATIKSLESWNILHKNYNDDGSGFYHWFRVWLFIWFKVASRCFALSQCLHFDYSLLHICTHWTTIQGIIGNGSLRYKELKEKK